MRSSFLKRKKNFLDLGITPSYDSSTMSTGNPKYSSPRITHFSRISIFILIAALSLLWGCGKSHLENVEIPPESLLQGDSLPSMAADLKAKEAALGDVRPGLERQIIFADPENPAPTEYVLIFFPGFTASHEEMNPVHINVARELGANLLLYRFSGQCRTPDAYQDLQAEQWLNDGIKALFMAQELGNKIVVMGASTGSSIALLANSARGMNVESINQPVPEISNLVLISPNLGPADPLAEILLWPGIGKLLVSIVEGPYRSYEVTNPAELYCWDSTHHSDGLYPMMQVVDWARKLSFKDLQTPAMVIYDPQDQVVNQQKTLELMGQAAHGTVQFYEMNSQDQEHHNMASQIKAPESIEEVQRGILRYLTGTLN